jgi:hypothetical protein
MQYDQGTAGRIGYWWSSGGGFRSINSTKYVCGQEGNSQFVAYIMAEAEYFANTLNLDRKGFSVRCVKD